MLQSITARLNQRIDRQTANPARRRIQTNTLSHCVAIESLEQRALLAGVNEIDPIHISPLDPIEFQGNDYFINPAQTSPGHELIRGTDGSVVHRAEFSTPPLVANGYMLFAASTTDNGIELYRSDGTTAGTVLVKNINPGSESSLDSSTWQEAVVFKDRLYFVADDGVHGQELWVSDGTEAGTVLLKDINQTQDSKSKSAVNALTVADDILYFLANDHIVGQELWKTDGTSQGTVLVSDFTTGSSTTIFRIKRVVDDGILINARDAAGARTDYALWHVKGDGSRELITDQEHVLDAYMFNGDVFFMYEGDRLETTSAGELWVKRAGSTTLEKLYDSPHGEDGRAGGFHGVLNDRLVFSHGKFVSGFPNVTELSLLSTDGSTVEMLQEFALTFDLRSLSYPQSPAVLDAVELNGEWLFSSFVPRRGFELVATDGTAAGTRLVKDISVGDSVPAHFARFNDRVWFIAEIKHPNPNYTFRLLTLWSTDGTEAGTVQESTLDNFRDVATTENGVYVAKFERTSLGFHRGLYRITDTDVPAPTITTPQTELNGLVEWEAVEGADHYEVFESKDETPPAGSEGVEIVDRPTYLPTRFGQTQVFVRTVKDGLRSEWSRGIFYALTVPVFTKAGQEFVYEEFASFYSEISQRLRQHFEQANGLEAHVQFFDVENPDVTLTLGDDPIPAGTYQWRGRNFGYRDAVSDYRFSEWTELQTLHILADRVKLITPFASQDEARPTFRWTRYYGRNYWLEREAADTYTLQVHNVTTGEDVLLLHDLIDLEYTPNFDLPAGNYRAWVLPHDLGERKIWSQAIEFSIGMEITGIAPTGQISNDQPTITWDAVNGDVTYEIWANQHGGPNRIFYGNDLNTNSFQVPESLSDGFYKVWVRAHFSNGEKTPWSQRSDFTLGDQVVPLMAGPSGPIDDSTPTFRWTGPSDVTHWRLHIRDLDAEQNTIVSEDVLTATEYTIPTELPDSRYAVWVRGFRNGEAVTVWSPPARFYIGDYPELTGPAEFVTGRSPAGPRGIQGIVGTFIRHTWTPVAGATGYEFTMRHVQGRAQAMYAPNVQGTSITATSLLPTGTYRSWVRAINADGTKTRWSDMVEFTIATNSTENLPEDLKEGELQFASFSPEAMFSAVAEDEDSTPREDDVAPERKNVPQPNDTPEPLVTHIAPVDLPEQHRAYNDAEGPDAELTELIDVAFRELPHKPYM